MIANNRAWTMGAFLLTVVILAAGWFVGVSPMLSQASAAAAAKEDTVSQNVAYETRLVSLRKRFEQIDEFKAALDGQRRLIPAGAELPGLLGQLGRIQAAAGVTLTDFALSDALAFAPASAEEQDVQDAADGTALPAENVNSVSTSRITGENFAAIPISMTTQGSFEQVMAFVAGIQNGERLFLVTNLSVVEESEEGSFTGSLSGFVYVLLDETVTPSEPVTPADPASAEID